MSTENDLLRSMGMPVLPLVMIQGGVVHLATLNGPHADYTFGLERCDTPEKLLGWGDEHMSDNAEPRPDPIADLFEQAIDDAMLVEVDQYWPELYMLAHLLYGHFVGDSSTAMVVDNALQAMQQHRNVAGLPSTEAAQICVALELLRDALAAYFAATHSIMRKIGARTVELAPPEDGDDVFL